MTDTVKYLEDLFSRFYDRYDIPIIMTILTVDQRNWIIGRGYMIKVIGSSHYEIYKK
jgi:hypothetical protein